jgi:predicted acylesterase/phospholipase RssA
MIESLVFSSGGVRGISYIGAVAELVRLNVVQLQRVRQYIGTSVGALVACLFALGYTPDELTPVAMTPQRRFVSFDLAYFIYNWGLSSQHELLHFIATMVDAKLGAGATLGDLLRRRGVLLRVCITNLTENRAEYPCPITTPNMTIVDAVAMSCALPPLFAPIWRNGCLYVDGALIDSFPTHGLNPLTTLGLKLEWGVARNITSMESCYARIAYVALAHTSKETDVPVVIITVDTSTTNLDTTRQVKRDILDEGRKSASRFVLDMRQRAPCNVPL